MSGVPGCGKRSGSVSGTLPQLKPVISPRNRRVVKITAFPRAGNVRSCLCSQKPGAATRRTDGNVLHTDNRDGFIPPRVNPGCGSGLRCVLCVLCVVRAAERVSQGKGLVCSLVSPAASTTGGFICVSVIAQWEPNTTWVSSASLFWDSETLIPNAFHYKYMRWPGGAFILVFCKQTLCIRMCHFAPLSDSTSAGS